MAHFTAYCERYPSFSFNVPDLRASFVKRGEPYRSTNMRFVERVFDSQAAGLTSQEATIVLDRLKSMTSWPPLWGQHILVRENKKEPVHERHEQPRQREIENQQDPATHLH